MKNRPLAMLLGLTAIVSGSHALADSTWVYAVQISATVQTSPPRITLSWPQDMYGANSYTVYRKTKDSGSWGSGTALPGSVTSYVDNNVTVGATYEYQIVKAAQLGYTGYGYIYAGIDAPLVDSRGKVILVVDSSQAASLASELNQLQQDLVGDGWTVVRRDVVRTNDPAAVKSVIKAAYNADPINTKALFLFGHVPIFRCGNLDIDGHQPRKLPADGFYGDMDGTWNDPSTIPSDIDLMVGRVDLFNMPVAGRSETELLRNYLNKDHNWRHKRIVVPRRALVGDLFGDTFPDERFAASGFRNFEPFVGPGNIVRANEKYGSPPAEKWSSMLSAGTYLWAYGCGAGSYTSMAGMGTHGDSSLLWSSDITAGDLRAVFFMMFGSWFGEWDSTDNLMRAVLATPTMGLTCSWAGRPHWYCHHMGLGEPIGYSTRLSQNNNGLYQNQANLFTRGVHIALMGDPTLRMHSVAPPSAVTTATISGGTRVSWTASPDTVAGYHVYRGSNPAGPYARLTTSVTTGPSFADTSAGTGGYTYMVRAVKLENTPSGTYYNASQGAFSGSQPDDQDTVPPQVTIVTPTSTVLSGTNVEITALATDNVGVAGVQFQIDGIDSGAEDTTAPYTVRLNTTSMATGIHRITAAARDAAGNRALSLPASVTVTNVVASGGEIETVWFDDVLPAGASPGASGGDSWNWVTSPTRSGAVAHQSTGTGNQQHYFSYATDTLAVNTGDVLMAWIYLDPANPPQEVMLQWTDGSWEHRAYWGLSLNTFGVEGTQSRRAMGPLPATGQWVRLEVPAQLVGLEGRIIKGMAFTLFDGGATWDRVGKFSPGSTELITLSARQLAGGLRLSWNATAGNAYVVQSSTNLTIWTVVDTVTADSDAASWTDSSPSAPHRFFRIVAE